MLVIHVLVIVSVDLDTVSTGAAMSLPKHANYSMEWNAVVI
jgi:hypothetical protein